MFFLAFMALVDITRDPFGTDVDALFPVRACCQHWSLYASLHFDRALQDFPLLESDRTSLLYLNSGTDPVRAKLDIRVQVHFGLSCAR